MGIRDTDRTLPSNQMVFELRRDAQAPEQRARTLRHRTRVI